MSSEQWCISRDVPAAVLTCPLTPFCPAPWEDASPNPNQVTVSIPWGEVGQWLPLPGGMLILCSCREDYQPLNPPTFLHTLTPVGSCAGAAEVLEGAGGGLHPPTHPNTPCQVFPVPSPHAPTTLTVSAPSWPRVGLSVPIWSSYVAPATYFLTAPALALTGQPLVLSLLEENDQGRSRTT